MAAHHVPHCLNVTACPMTGTLTTAYLLQYKVVGYTPEGAKVVDLVKDIRPITYSAMLDMSPFANLALRESGESMLYGLCAVQLHDGRTPSSGHWTSLQQVGQDSWVIRNDMEAPRAVSTAQALSFQRECSMFLYSRLR